jgi:hypothetical protein
MIPRTPETVREASFAVKHALAPGNRGGWKATEPLRWVNFCGAGSAGKLLGTGLMELVRDEQHIGEAQGRCKCYSILLIES